ncbi:MAG: pyridoxamine 5'-phosphate oxidase family protein [Waddliaceae bacterium]
MNTQKDFEIDSVLKKPLMAHLSTVEDGEPRDSPVWFIWENSFLWIFGITEDSFIMRLKKEPCCAVGTVDFDLEKGILRHVGIRGKAQLSNIDNDRLKRFVSKYLGNDKQKWNSWFVKNIVDPLDVMVQITPKTIVAKDVSFFKTGPNLANFE